MILAMNALNLLNIHPYMSLTDLRGQERIKIYTPDLFGKRSWD